MLRQELALGHVEGGGKRLLELLNEPSLNINGIASGQVGARSAIQKGRRVRFSAGC